MRQCPVCEKDTSENLCPVCGFDFSRDYEHAPTFAPTMSIAARRKAWQEREKWNIEEEQHRQEREKWNIEEEQHRQEREKWKIDEVQRKQEKKRAAKYDIAREEEIKSLKEEIKDLKKGIKLAELKRDSAEKHYQETDQRLKEALHRANERRRSSSVDYKSILKQAMEPANIPFCILAALLLGYCLIVVFHSIFVHADIAFGYQRCATRWMCEFLTCDAYTLHDWQDMGCLMPRQCRVCGATSGGTSSHIWCDEDGDQNKTCHLCGVDQEPPWFFMSNPQDYDPTTNASDLTLQIRFPDDANVPFSSIAIHDYTNSAVQGYTHAWDGNVLNITFDNPPTTGRYRIYAEKDNILTPITDEYYGRKHDPIPDFIHIPEDFQVKHLLTDLWLCEENDQLVASKHTDWKNATVFSDLSALSSLTAAAGEIICTANLMIPEDGDYCHLYAFEQDGRCLAANSNGTVYWSNELTDECYWLIQEEAY